MSKIFYNNRPNSSAAELSESLENVECWLCGGADSDSDKDILQVRQVVRRRRLGDEIADAGDESADAGDESADAGDESADAGDEGADAGDEGAGDEGAPAAAEPTKRPVKIPTRSRHDAYSITFGQQVESDYRSEKLGEMAKIGLSFRELEDIRDKFIELIKDRKLENWPRPELHDLTDNLETDLRKMASKLKIDPKDIPDMVEANSAGLLIIRGAADLIMGEGAADRFYKQQSEINYDDKGNSYGKVINKLARHTVVFGEKNQVRKPKLVRQKDGKDYFISTIVGFDTDKTKLLTELRRWLQKFLPLKGKAPDNREAILLAEGNHYFELSPTTKPKAASSIGWHGDKERKIIVCLRLGQGGGNEQPLAYQWYTGTGHRVGKPIIVQIRHGDIYIMSEKASGWDWLTNTNRNDYLHLEHAANKAVVHNPPDKFTDRAKKKKTPKVVQTVRRSRPEGMTKSMWISKLIAEETSGDQLPEVPGLSPEQAKRAWAHFIGVPYRE